jgi:predicted ATPase with chaperone activity
MVLVGLPEMAVRESIHRIERAFANLGYDRHPGRTVINLAPADLGRPWPQCSAARLDTSTACPTLGICRRRCALAC